MAHRSMLPLDWGLLSRTWPRSYRISRASAQRSLPCPKKLPGDFKPSCVILTGEQWNCASDEGPFMKHTVEVYSDVICPWCYIGKRRLETAISALDSSQEVR